MPQTRPQALIAGASCAIGLVYADRLARRGYDLVLLAKTTDRPGALARLLRAETDAAVKMLATDMSTEQGIEKAETLVAGESNFDLVVNNLGQPPGRLLAEERASDLDRLIDVNVRAYARFAAAASRSMVRRSVGAIVNIASVVGLAPEIAAGAYGASQAFVVALTRSMQSELGQRGVYVQLVLSAATRTDVWPFQEREPENLPGIMTSADLVDAALAGFELREAVTIPSLAKAARWSGYERARRDLLSNLVSSEPAERYRRRT